MDVFDGEIRQFKGGAYYLVTHPTQRWGVKLTGYKRPPKTRKVYSLKLCDVIAEADVPDSVWAALAEYRLTS